MKSNWLKLYTLFSLLFAMMVWYVPTDSISSNLTETLQQSNTFLSAEIENLINDIEDNALWYPEYKHSEIEAKRIDNLLQSNPTQNDTLFTFLSNFFSKEKRLPNFDKNDKTVYYQNDLLSKTWKIQKRYLLANHFQKKTRGLKLCCFCGPELVLLNNHRIEPNQLTDLQFGLSYSGIQLKNMRFWINGKTAPTRDGKAVVKQKATKSGWKTLKIKYQGEYQNQIFIDSLIYRYFVCD